MQINGGANNMFAAWANSGGMTMGYFDPKSKADQPLWNWARSMFWRTISSRVRLAGRF